MNNFLFGVKQQSLTHSLTLIYFKMSKYFTICVGCFSLLNKSWALLTYLKHIYTFILLLFSYQFYFRVRFLVGFVLLDLYLPINPILGLVYSGVRVTRSLPSYQSYFRVRFIVGFVLLDLYLPINPILGLGL